MILYIFVFLLTILFTHRAQILINTHKKQQFFVCSALVILLPSILAGLRGELVGTDILVYVKPVYSIANRYNSFFEFVSYMKGTSFSCTELGYLMITYFSNSLQMLLFSIQFITMYYIYKALLVFRKQIPMWLGMFVYLTICYCVSLNLMRQCIAMAIVLYASTQLIQKRYIKFSIYVVLASLFHSSAVGMFTLLFLWFAIGIKVKRWKIWTILVTVCIFIALWNPLTNLIAQLGLIPSQYYKYIIGNISLDFYSILLQFPFLIFEVLLAKSVRKKTPIFSYYYAITTISFLLIPIATLWTYSYRILYYFYIFRTFTIPMVWNGISDIRNKKNMQWCMLLYLTIYWLWSTRNSSSLPYAFFWN